MSKKANILKSLECKLKFFLVQAKNQFAIKVNYRDVLLLPICLFANFTLTLSLSLSLTHTHTLSFSLTLTHTSSLSLSLSLFLNFCRSLPRFFLKGQWPSASGELLFTNNAQGQNDLHSNGRGRDSTKKIVCQQVCTRERKSVWDRQRKRKTVCVFERATEKVCVRERKRIHPASGNINLSHTHSLDLLNCRIACSLLQNNSTVTSFIFNVLISLFSFTLLSFQRKKGLLFL